MSGLCAMMRPSQLSIVLPDVITNRQFTRVVLSAGTLKGATTGDTTQLPDPNIEAKKPLIRPKKPRRCDFESGMATIVITGG